jgi:TRAP-type transport system periplasmic protein
MKRFYVILMGAVFLSGLILSLATDVASAEKPIELRLSHIFPSGSSNDLCAQRWAKRIEEDSKGALKIRIFPNAVLISAVETYFGIAKGIADIGLSLRYSRKGAEFSELITLYLAGTPDAAIGTKILDEAVQRFPEYDKDWQETKKLWVISIGPSNIITKPRPIRTLEDVKGIQLRVPAREGADVLKEMGGTAVGLPLSEMLMAMQKGTVDGCTINLQSMEAFKVVPPAKYCTLFSLYNPSSLFTVMNWDSFKKLPPHLQKVIEDSREQFKRDIVQVQDDADKHAMEWGKKLGMEFFTLGPEERKKWFSVIERIQRREAADLDSKGYPGTDLLKFVKGRMDAYIK